MELSMSTSTNQSRMSRISCNAMPLVLMAYSGSRKAPSFGALLCARSASGKAKLPFKFAVLASGFMPRAVALRSEVGEDAPLIAKHALIVAGKTDQMVTPDRSAAMTTRFTPKAELYEHERGHVLDYSPATTAAIAAFFDKFRSTPSIAADTDNSAAVVPTTIQAKI